MSEEVDQPDAPCSVNEDQTSFPFKEGEEKSECAEGTCCEQSACEGEVGPIYDGPEGPRGHAGYPGPEGPDVNQGLNGPDSERIEKIETRYELREGAPEINDQNIYDVIEEAINTVVNQLHPMFNKPDMKSSTGIVIVAWTEQPDEKGMMSAMTQYGSNMTTDKSAHILEQTTLKLKESIGTDNSPESLLGNKIIRP